jgi:hypothetical protein
MKYDQKLKIHNSRNWLAIGAATLTFCFGTVAACVGQAPPPPAGTIQQGAAPDQGQQYPVVPPTITLPAGTVVTVRTTGFLSSDQNKAGDTFNAVVDQPIVADGWVVVRRGQSVTGRVVEAQKAGRVSGVSHLGIDLGEITLVDGQVAPVKTELVKTSAGTSNGRDVATVGATTGVGAIIGAAAGGGEGAGIGAGAGALAGIAGVLLTRGRPTVLYPETLLTFRIDTPVSISTEKGQVAYQPVTQEDYAPNTNNQRRIGYGRPAYPPPYPYSYPYPNYYSYFPYYPFGYGFYYPGPSYFGFYGGYGFGFRGGFRGGRFRR